MTRQRGSTLPPQKMRRAGRTERPDASAVSRRHGPRTLPAELDLQERLRSFVRWLDSALLYRNIPDDATLASLCHISKSTIVHWRNLECVPSFDVCKALAHALDIPLLAVLVEAGHLTPADFVTIEDPQSGGRLLVARDDASLGTLPLPARDSYERGDPVERAKLAIQSVHDLSPSARMQIIGVLEALVTAAHIQSKMEAMTARA